MTPKPASKTAKKDTFTLNELIEWTEVAAQMDCDEGNQKDAARYMAINRQLRRLASRKPKERNNYEH